MQKQIQIYNVPFKSDLVKCRLWLFSCLVENQTNKVASELSEFYFKWPTVQTEQNIRLGETQLQR